MLNVQLKGFESRLMYIVKYTAKNEYLIDRTDKITVSVLSYHISYLNAIRYTNSSTFITIAAFTITFEFFVEIFLKKVSKFLISILRLKNSYIF